MIVTEKQQQTKQNKSNCISKCSRTFGKWHPLSICTTYNYRQSKGKPLWGKPASSGTETNLAAKFILRLSALITCLSSHVRRSNNPLICTEITAALTHTERAWLPLSPAPAAGCGHDTSRRPQPTQCPCVQEDEAGAITNLQLQCRRPNGWTCTDTLYCTKCPLQQTAGWNVWPTAVLLNTRLYGSKRRNQTRQPHSFCRLRGLSVQQQSRRWRNWKYVTQKKKRGLFTFWFV